MSLFEYPYQGNEPVDIAREYFDIFYSCGYFLDALGYWVQGIGFCTDGAWAHFGNMEDYDEYFHFEGVEIETGYEDPPDKIRIDEATFFRWLRMACERYVRKRPEHTREVKKLLAQAPM